MALKALLAGKHVLVEKPLAMSQKDLDQINAFYVNTSGPKPILLTGFNRRFSPHARRIKELVTKRTNPMVLNYRMNAGYIPLDHWVHTEEGGGRNIGEACHIYDLFTFLTGSKVSSVTAQAMMPKTSYYSATDNFVATFAFADGSIATLTYTASGSREYPKEQLEVFVDGMTIAMNDFKLLQVTGSKSVGLETKLSEKGQKEELEIFAKAIKTGGDWPILLWEQNQATEMAIKVQHFLSGDSLINES
jgi:predicted dehydrogenase